MLPKKAVKVICIILAILMALSAVAALTAVFASDAADSSAVISRTGAGIIQSVLDYSGIVALAVLAAMGAVLCFALPKVNGKRKDRVRFDIK